MFAMHRTEGVIHIGAIVASKSSNFLSELAALCVVVGGFSGIKAYVLYQKDLAGAKIVSRLAGTWSGDVIGQCDVWVREFAHALRGGCQRGFGGGGPLGATEVRQGDDFCA